MTTPRLALVLIALLALTLLVPAPAAEPAAPAPVEVRLLDGSVLKGVVTSRSPEEITLRTADGTLRITAARMTQASRDALLGPEDPAACQARVRELEAQVRALEQENQDLRKRLAAAPAAARSLADTRVDSSRSSPSASHTISSTGKRHNSGCRYYGIGRACGPGEGVACKICGG